MSTKVKLTPKDCLYIDDSLSQLCAIKTRIMNEKADVSNQKVLHFIDEVEQIFTNQFDEMKNLLKEATE